MIRVAVIANAEFGESGSDREPGVQPDVVEVVRSARTIEFELNRSPLFAAELKFVRSLADVRAILELGNHDVVFNLIESLQCSQNYESAAAALLENYSLPYTGSPPLPLRQCLDKMWTTTFLRRHGVPVPRSLLLTPESLHASEVNCRQFPLPAIVKPCRTDGSVGISQASVVRSHERLLAQAQALARQFDGRVIVQEFLQGRELRVACLGNNPIQLMPITEIVFDLPPEAERVYDYDSKWKEESDSYDNTYRRLATVPAPLRHRLESLARRVFDLMGLRDYGTIEFRLDENGEPHVIDVNANCDLGEEAWFSYSCSIKGISHGDLVRRILSMAIARSRRVEEPPSPAPVGLS